MPVQPEPSGRGQQAQTHTDELPTVIVVEFDVPAMVVVVVPMSSSVPCHVVAGEVAWLARTNPGFAWALSETTPGWMQPEWVGSLNATVPPIVIVQ